MISFFRTPALSNSHIAKILALAKEQLQSAWEIQKTEKCFYVETENPLSLSELEVLAWLLSETFEPHNFSPDSFLLDCPFVLEIGPRLNFETSWSSTAVSICHACGLNKIQRLEYSIRYGFATRPNKTQVEIFLGLVHDRMTENPYEQPLKSFEVDIAPQPVQIIPLMEMGIPALQEINKKLGLGMDEQDFQMYHELFVGKLGRNPTDVELFQLAQANSEHSRHHFFKGQLIVDGVLINAPANETLMQIVMAPWKQNPRNSLIAFCDDSSAISGGEIHQLVPNRFGKYHLRTDVFHPTLTAETHNHPTGVQPYKGSATGGGGRIRDNHAVGRGGLVGVGGAGYCTANLCIPGYQLPWEKNSWSHPSNLASPLDILIQASNGASDYGNCFGEPIVYGFKRSFGMLLPEGYRAWFKPLMYSVGAGQINNQHTKKSIPQKGMLVVQIGGPAYRIGIGGGSASSMISGDNIADLDFNSVQRDAAEMEQRLNRVIRACIELGNNNPIMSCRDLGAGGDCNALPEIVDPAGAKINIRSIPIGDKTLSALEIWGNESQERDAILIWPEKLEVLKKICEREGLPYAVVGEVTGDGMLIVYDPKDNTTPVNLPLEKILGKLPQKKFILSLSTQKRESLVFPENLTVRGALERVLRHLSVCSTRFLTTKVDRSVTGLVAQQQCVGPNQLPLSDYALYAQSHFDTAGVALSLGEQPIKGLISPKACARLAVSEALLNMCGVVITAREDIRCSANWMLAAKLQGEGAWLYMAACALRDICISLGIAIDGGKDSLSMATKTKAHGTTMQVVKAPGELVIAAYAPVMDITRKVTCEFKKSGNGIILIDLACGKNRLGGSALAQVFGQIGNVSPDIDDVNVLTRTFSAIQELAKRRWICAVHDRSDGGIITTLLEMAFAGNLGFDIHFKSKETNSLALLFCEEPGLIIECPDVVNVLSYLKEMNVPAEFLGATTNTDLIVVRHNGEVVLSDPMTDLRTLWEETSTQLDKIQANPACVLEEAHVAKTQVTPPPYQLTFAPIRTPQHVLRIVKKPKVAVLRERGSNGDREMASALYKTGFEVWDVTMTDILSGRINLDPFRGIAFPGGFSFGDVFDAGKGWAGVIKYNPTIAQQFENFYRQDDTFSFGVCNGCQLMALLGWVPWTCIPAQEQPRFIRNQSERFESRFATIKILPSPAIMLRGMENSVLGVWVAHGEGKFYAPENILKEILEKNLAPIRYVDNNGGITTTYPYNPNGSPYGITSLTTPDGRHLALMPHPERTFLKWQWQWMPDTWAYLKESPWLRFFQNAYHWCIQSPR